LFTLPPVTVAIDEIIKQGHQMPTSVYIEEGRMLLETMG